MKLRYTRRAAAELDGILAFIAEVSPNGSRRVHRRIRAITELLLRYPLVGEKTSNRRLRRIAATPYPYVVFYEHSGEEVIIIGVRHAARDPRSMPT